MSSTGLPLYQGNVDPSGPGDGAGYVTVTPGQHISNYAYSPSDFNQSAQYQSDLLDIQTENMAVIGPFRKALDWIEGSGSFDPQLQQWVNAGGGLSPNRYNALTAAGSSPGDINAHNPNNPNTTNWGSVAMIVALGAAAIFAIPMLVKAFRD